MTSSVTKFIDTTIEKMRAYEARLAALAAKLAPVEAIVVPDGQSVAALFDRMDRGKMAWSLFDTAALQKYYVKYTDSPTRDDAHGTTTYFALIVSQLLKGVCYEYIDDEDYHEVEKDYTRFFEAAELRRKAQYEDDDGPLCTRNKFAVDPLPVSDIVRTLLEHVELTPGIMALVRQFSSAMLMAQICIEHNHECQKGQCPEKENSEDDSGDCICEDERNSAEDALVEKQDCLLDAITATPTFDSLRDLIPLALGGRKHEYTPNYKIIVLASEADARQLAESLAREEERKRKAVADEIAREEKFVEQQEKQAAAARNQLAKKKAKLV